MAREFVESKWQTWGFNIFPQGKFLEIRRASLNVLIEPADRVKVSDPWVGKIAWRRERLPTPVFWPREFHGPYSPWGHKELDMNDLSDFSIFPRAGSCDTWVHVCLECVHAWSCATLCDPMDCWHQHEAVCLMTLETPVGGMRKRDREGNKASKEHVTKQVIAAAPGAYTHWEILGEWDVQCEGTPTSNGQVCTQVSTTQSADDRWGLRGLQPLH